MALNKYDSVSAERECIPKTCSSAENPQRRIRMCISSIFLLIADFMQPFLEPCLLGAIHYLTTQMKISTPDNITPYVEILSSLLEFLSPSQQEDDLFSTMPLEPKTSRVLQILAPSILCTISHLTVEQTAPAKPLFDQIMETLRPYTNQFRPELSLNRKEAYGALRGTLSTLAQWSAGWSSGFVVPEGLDLRCLDAAVGSCGASVVIRHLVDEMWAAQQTSGHHAGKAPILQMMT